MSKLRVVAIPSEMAQKVRKTKLSPWCEHPVTSKVATGHGPCRHCLMPFAVGIEVRLLMTMNAFADVGGVPQPGPVFLHERTCRRYAEGAGFPKDLLEFGSVLDGYDDQQLVRRREQISDCSQERMLEQMMGDALIRYVMVRDAKAGCYDFRVERREG